MKKLLFTILLLSITACSTKDTTQKQSKLDETVITTKDGSQVKVEYGCAYTSYIDDIPGAVGFSDCNKIHEGIRIYSKGQAVAITVGEIGAVLTCLGSAGIICPKVHNGKTGVGMKLDDPIFTYAYPKYIELVKNKLTFQTLKNYTSTPIRFFKDHALLKYDEKNSGKYIMEITYYIHVPGMRMSKAKVCNEKVSGFTQEEWLNNNFEKIIVESKKMIDKCFTQLDNNYFNDLSIGIEQVDKL